MKKLLVNIGLFFLYSLVIIIAGVVGIFINLGYIITFPIWAIKYIINPEKYLKKFTK